MARFIHKCDHAGLGKRAGDPVDTSKLSIAEVRGMIAGDLIEPAPSDDGRTPSMSATIVVDPSAAAKAATPPVTKPASAAKRK